MWTSGWVMNVQMRVHTLLHNLFTRSHPSEEESRSRNRSKNCKCKQDFRELNTVQLWYFSLQSIYDIYPKEEEIQIIEEHLKKEPPGIFVLVFAIMNYTEISRMTMTRSYKCIKIHSKFSFTNTFNN
jgi:hypothetical protein